MLVSPSLSGRYALPFLVREHPQLRGFVPIAPASTLNYTREQLQAVKVPGGGHPAPAPPWGKGCLTWRTHDPNPDLPSSPIWVDKMGVWGGPPRPPEA